MVTIEERRKARQAKSKARFAASGKKAATSLSKTAETTAQRRGRGFDPLETVILQAVAPPPPPPPPKPRSRLQQAQDAGLISCGPALKRGQTVSRGVSFICPGVAIQFSSSANNTTRQFFGSQINTLQQKLRAGGFGDLIPPSPQEIINSSRAIKIARRKGDTNKLNKLKAASCKRKLGNVSRSNCRNLGLQGFDVGF